MRRRFICNYKFDTNEIWYTSRNSNIVIPNSVFAFGANIVSNNYSSGKGIIKFDGDVTTIGNYAFQECVTLQSITIPKSVTSIGNNAFNYCTRLASVTIPNGVTSIGEGAFYYCTSLTSVTIGNSVTTIGYAAFADCTSLTSIYCKATTPPALDGNYIFDYSSGRKIYVPYQSLNAYKTAEYWSNYAADIVGYDFENDTVVGGGNNLITFTINGTDYQAEEGMTFYDWAMSEYYDDSCPLSLLTLSSYDLRNGIIQENISPGDAIGIVYGAGLPLIPGIDTDTIIQPISYMPDTGGIDEVG